MSDLVAHDVPPVVEIGIPQVILVHLDDARHDEAPPIGPLVDPDPWRFTEVGIAHDYDPVDLIAIVIHRDPLGRQLHRVALLPVGKCDLEFQLPRVVQRVLQRQVQTAIVPFDVVVVPRHGVPEQGIVPEALVVVSVKDVREVTGVPLRPKVARHRPYVPETLLSLLPIPRLFESILPGEKARDHEDEECDEGFVHACYCPVVSVGAALVLLPFRSSLGGFPTLLLDGGRRTFAGLAVIDGGGERRVRWLDLFITAVPYHLRSVIYLPNECGDHTVSSLVKASSLIIEGEVP
jgi:hypothetical protein